MAKNVKVQFEADTAKFNRGIEQVNAGLDRVKNRAGAVGAALKGALAFAGVGAIGGALSKGVTEADKIARAADASGVNVEDLQRLALFARLDFDQAGKVLGNVNAGIGKAAAGGKTQSAALAAFGFSEKDIRSGNISLTDLILRAGDAASIPEGEKGFLSDAVLNSKLQDLGFGTRGREFVRGLRGDTAAVLKGNERSVASARAIATLNLSRSNLDSYGEFALAKAIELEASGASSFLGEDAISEREAQLTGNDPLSIKIREIRKRINNLQNQSGYPTGSASVGYGAAPVRVDNTQRIEKLTERMVQLLEEQNRKLDSGAVVFP